MTPDEARNKLQRIDEAIKESEGVPSIKANLLKQRQALVEAHPFIFPSIKAGTELDKFITVHPDMIRLKSQIQTLANHPDSILIMGESGTGKEILARALHGDRRGKFIDINCAGLPEYLVESMLFGHKRGAFTGADMDREGLIWEANGGTLFLDEIGELGMMLQAKLLRVLQERKYRRVGDNEMIREATCRFVSATNHNLMEQVNAKLFRLDLFARLGTFQFCTLPLRIRRADIQPICEALAVGSFDAINGEMKGELMNAMLPLNVRELQSYIRRWQVFGTIY